MKTEQQQNFDSIESCNHCGAEFLDAEMLEDHKQQCTEKPEEPEKPEPTQRDSEAENSSVKKLPVSRDYNFTDRIPSDIPEYMDSNGELNRILADIANKKESGQMPRYLISGDTGAGKTHAVKKIAEKRDAPLFTIQGKYDLDQGDLLGSPVLVNGKTVWTDGTLTKALLESQEREVVLLLDELNRTRPESKGILFSALDNRCRVELDARSGEVIEGNPQNLIVVGTINEGSDYKVEPLDKAEKRRFGRKFEVEHLGINHPEKEAEVIQKRSPACLPVAEKLVEIANEVREASESPESVVDQGVPTSSLIDWSRTAYAYSVEGIDNPVVKAGIDSVVKPIYDNGRIRKDVEETIRDHADDAPFKEEEFKEWSDSPEKYSDSVCEYCGEQFSSKRGVSLHQSQSDCGE